MTAAPDVLPDPFVPAGVDLAGMAFMPLDVSRVLDSDLFALSTGEEFKAAVALWCKSWMQVPAGSLPNNDRVLAHLSGANSRWAKLKVQALHGWQLCSDGRLYHAVIAEKALTAWGERLSYLEKQAADTERKRLHREESKELRGQLAVHGVHVAWNESVAVMRTMLQQLPQTSHKDSDAPVTRTGASPATDLSPNIKREVKVKVKDLNQEHVPSTLCRTTNTNPEHRRANRAKHSRQSPTVLSNPLRRSLSHRKLRASLTHWPGLPVSTACTRSARSVPRPRRRGAS
ncbi:DUF1376 domain-containing protein [Pseudomonas huanghezhanensis]|uniref:DUF1376 domain-containing protein n=1 Tax=Pseudomonas huanghezhanensis TaxID=3002903 RepID=UPI002285E341|nr:DUF1376 domain-containing protein [Pseudomonas sp. BSw22131]